MFCHKRKGTKNEISTGLMFMLAFSYHDDFCDTKSCDEFVDFISLAALQPVHNRLGSMGYELQEFEKLFFSWNFFVTCSSKSIKCWFFFLYPELSFFWIWGLDEWGETASDLGLFCFLLENGTYMGFYGFYCCLQNSFSWTVRYEYFAQHSLEN